MENVNLKNFTIISILFMLTGFLSPYYPPNNYQDMFQSVFEIGVLCFILAYFLYALKCWGARSKICAVLMVSVPTFAYSLATSKIPESTTNILLYLAIVFCLYAIISVIVLYLCDKGKKGIDQYIFKRTWRSRGYFYPKLSYSIIGVLVVSFLALNYGGIAIFSDNMNSVLRSSTNYAFNSQNGQSTPIPVRAVAEYATIQTPQTNIINSIGNAISNNIPSFQSFTSVNESMKDIDYINSIRASNGVNPIKFDNRVYNLAMARVNDMDKYGYLDHTNPQTGTCAFSLKSEYGLTSNEYVAENAFGFSSSTGNNYYSGIEKDAINAWMSD
ncbi:MAG: CAP domain-containing protein [Methanoregula sp.]|jgi:uncharacterized protein YkwD